MRTGISMVGLVAVLWSVPEKAYPKESPDIRSLLADLRSPDSGIAGEASVSLLKMAEALNPSVIRLACSAAARVKEDKARPWMVKIVLNPFFDPSTRSLCALAAGRTTVLTVEEDEEDKAKISSNVIEALITVLDSSEPLRVRAGAARSLGYTYSKKAVCPLYDISKNLQDNSVVRYLASNSLTRITNFISRVQEKKIPSCSPGPEIPPGGSFVTSGMILAAQAAVITDYGNLIGLALPPQKK